MTEKAKKLKVKRTLVRNSSTVTPAVRMVVADVWLYADDGEEYVCGHRLHPVLGLWHREEISYYKSFPDQASLERGQWVKGFSHKELLELGFNPESPSFKTGCLYFDLEYDIVSHDDDLFDSVYGNRKPFVCPWPPEQDEAALEGTPGRDEAKLAASPGPPGRPVEGGQGCPGCPGGQGCHVKENRYMIRTGVEKVQPRTRAHRGGSRCAR